MSLLVILFVYALYHYNIEYVYFLKTLDIHIVIRNTIPQSLDMEKGEDNEQ